MKIFFSEILQRLDIICNVLVSFRRACFNCIMNIYTFNSCNMKAGRFHFFFHRTDSLTAPHFPRCRIVKRRDYARNARNLADLLKRNRVKFASVPSQCHFHNFHTFLF